MGALTRDSEPLGELGEEAIRSEEASEDGDREVRERA